MPLLDLSRTFRFPPSSRRRCFSRSCCAGSSSRWCGWASGWPGRSPRVAADPRHGHGDEPDVRAHAVVRGRRDLERLGAGARRGATRALALENVLALADGLSPERAAKVRAGVIAYAKGAAEQEWPAMAE